ncbi:hypothetical protein [Mycolicibacterium hassiacum]|uniref:hypothetical protein n=2 Tax=Mycolicibacterium hassiacum TaxID=46351 RepID=UPI000F4D28E1|nr:hypothetical protein [Mycolicibacterium hassiacum]
MAKKQQQRPTCMFCGSSEPVTKEHIFRSSWKKNLEVNQDLVLLPGVERKFRRYRQDDGSMVRDTSEDLFSVIVKRVCAPCNNKWMNDLDSIVEPWVFNPDDDDNRCDPNEFRRWAIKVALLRIHYDAPMAVEPEDPPRIYAGEDIPEWHVFIGHTAEPEHRHSLCGIGPVQLAIGGKAFGITQVSWTLGHSLVTALRVHGIDEVSKNCFLNFRQYNGVRRGVVREVTPTATEMRLFRVGRGLV